MKNMAVALAAAGCRVLVMTGRDEDAERDVRIEDGVEVHYWYTRSEIGSPSVTREVLALAEREGVDLIEGADLYGECRDLLAVEQRPPIHIKVHGCHVIEVLRDSHQLKWWQGPLIRASLLRERAQMQRERYCIRNADVLTVPSHRLREELIQQGGLAAERAKVLPNPAAPADSQARLEAEVPTILFVGRIDIGKGIEFLPELVRQVRVQVPEAILEIAGGDSYARGLGSIKEWLSREFGELSGAVRFLGRLNEESLQDAYRRAWCLILPSRWNNFPTVVLEAMSHGCPVVASTSGGAPEILAETSNVSAAPGSVEFVSGVCSFLTDHALRERAVEEGRRRVSCEYSGATIAATYLRVMGLGAND